MTATLKKNHPALDVAIFKFKQSYLRWTEQSIKQYRHSEKEACLERSLVTGRGYARSIETACVIASHATKPAYVGTISLLRAS
jgi:hypothetical protein